MEFISIIWYYTNVNIKLHKSQVKEVDNMDNAKVAVKGGEYESDKKCGELTDFIQQIIHRNQDANFLQLLLTTAIALERQFNK